MLEFLSRLDRRVVYLIVAAAVIGPLLYPIGLPLVVSKQVQDFHQAISDIPDGSTVILAMDYDPSAIPELQPMSIAVLHQLFAAQEGKPARNLKVIGLSLWNAGPPLVDRAFRQVASRVHGKTYGVDYINLGFKEGREIVMTNMAKDLHDVWKTDATGQPLANHEITKNIRNYDDIAAIICISGGYPGLKEWIQQVQSVYGKKVIGGTTGVSAPEYYPYYQSGQLLGLLEGLKGAAEYEKKVGVTGTATSGMDAQSTGHWVIAAFVVLGNLISLLERRKRP